MFFLPLHRLTHTKLFHSFRLIFQFKPPHRLDYYSCGPYLPIYIFIFCFSRDVFSFTKPFWVARQGEFFLLHICSQAACLSTVVKTQALCTPPAKCWIRRIMATSDFHHRSVVYHPWSKSPLTQFVHVHCKTGCQTMVDRGGESRLASEGEQYMDSFKGLVNNT